MQFTESEIIALYDAHLAAAGRALGSLPFAGDVPPILSGLNGWVFEKTIRHCLEKELAALSIKSAILEQVPLKGRARVDLLVGPAAIELKARGSFGTADAKYEAYRRIAEVRGWVYLYLAMQEGHPQYRSATQRTFGLDQTFFLDTPGDWERFVRKVIAIQR